MTQITKLEDFSLGLNEGQTIAFNGLKDFIKDKHGVQAVLRGFAGTGKTFLVQRLIKHIHTKHPQFKIAVTAPTNKAVRVLSKVSTLKDMRVVYQTIHKLLGLKEVIHTDGKITFEPAFDTKNEINSFKVLIVDEVSMLDDSLFTMLQPYVNRIKIIYMGDPCFGRGTPILMANGSIKLIENINVNDFVMGPDSLPRRVLNTFNGMSTLFKINQSNGNSYITTGNHLLALKRRHTTSLNRYKSFGDYPLITVAELSTKSKKFFETFGGYRAGFINFEDRPIYIEPYYLGLWLGDGSKSRLIIATIDSEIIQYCEEYAKRISLICTIGFDTRKNKEAVRKLTIGTGIRGRKGNNLLSAFKKYSLLENKHIPDDFMINSEKVRLELLAGLIDSDGTLDKIGRRFIFGNNNKILIEQVKTLADLLGFRTKIITDKFLMKITVGNRIYIAKKLGMRVTISGDIWRIPTKIKRKQYSAEPLVKYNNKINSALKITPLNIEEYFGIEVDSDNLFLLNDGTVLHNCQIPPVNKPDCIPFNDEKKIYFDFKEYTLTEIMRQSLDNPIIEASFKIRNNLTKRLPIDELETKLNKTGNGIIRINPNKEADRNSVGGLFEKYFKSEKFEQDADHAKVIAWRNVTVNKTNNIIRSIIYSEESSVSKIMNGEKLVVRKPITDGLNIIIFTTSEELVVEEFDVASDTYPALGGRVRLKYYDTIVSAFDIEGKEFKRNINILHEDSQADFDKTAEALKANAVKTKGAHRAWAVYYEFIRIFADVGYNYCSTIHKAQGSTYTNVFVIEDDIDLNRDILEKNRILYTAYSRAAEKLFILKR